MTYREDECAPMGLDWRDAARDAAQDLARENRSTRRLTDTEVREMTPQYPWARMSAIPGRNDLLQRALGLGINSGCLER